MLAYLRLQLLNRWRGYLPGSARREGRSGVKAVASYVGFVILALYLLGLLIWLEMMLFQQAAALGQAESLISLALLTACALTLMTGFFSLSAQLFFSRDTEFVGALPISSRGILLVKCAMAALSEAGIALALLAPLFLRLGLFRADGAAYYVKAFFTCLALPLLPLTVDLFLSFALIRVSALWKRREGVTTVVSFGLMAGVMLLSTKMVNLNESEIRRLMLEVLTGRNGVASVLMRSLPPLQWASEGLSLPGWAGLAKTGGFVAISFGALALGIFALGRSYFHLALSQQQTMRKLNRAQKGARDEGKVRGAYRALLRQELKEVFLVPAYATNCLTGVVMFPLLVIVSYTSAQHQTGDLNWVSQLSQLVPSGYFLAGAMGLMAVVNGMGMAVSTAVSREGKRHEMRKTYPVSGKTHLLAKVSMGMLLNLITAASTGAALLAYFPSFATQILLAFLFGQIFSFLWCSLALFIDVTHPKLTWKTEMEAVKQNFNGFLSMLLSLGLTAALAGLVYVCVLLGASLEAGLLAATAVTLLGDGLCWRLLCGRGSQAYFLR